MVISVSVVSRFLITYYCKPSFFHPVQSFRTIAYRKCILNMEFPTQVFCFIFEGRTVQLSMYRQLEPRANSNQNRFPLALSHTIAAILPSVTRTLDYSNLPLTRTNFRFPSAHSLLIFTLDNSNHQAPRLSSRDTSEQTVYCSPVTLGFLQ